MGCNYIKVQVFTTLQSIPPKFKIFQHSPIHSTTSHSSSYYLTPLHSFQLVPSLSDAFFAHFSRYFSPFRQFSLHFTKFHHIPLLQVKLFFLPQHFQSILPHSTGFHTLLQNYTHSNTVHHIPPFAQHSQINPLLSTALQGGPPQYKTFQHSPSHSTTFDSSSQPSTTLHFLGTPSLIITSSTFHLMFRYFSSHFTTISNLSKFSYTYHHCTTLSFLP